MEKCLQVLKTLKSAFTFVSRLTNKFLIASRRWHFWRQENLQSFNFSGLSEKEVQSSSLAETRYRKFLTFDRKKHRKNSFSGMPTFRWTLIIINISMKRAFCQKKIVTGMLSRKKAKPEQILISSELAMD